MDLIRALRLEGTPRVALVGAGGKTRLLFGLAREYSRRGTGVILTTTTRLAVNEAAAAGAHISASASDDLTVLRRQPIQSEILVTGPEMGDGKVSAPGPSILAELAEIAAASETPLIVEADGSRRLPLKAPGENEPAIPQFSDIVVVVAGLSGIGQVLGPETVHRPNEFAELSGIRLGDTVTAEALARVLRHASGGLKNIPAHARRVLFLNQADRPARSDYGRQIASQAGDSYDSIVIGNLADIHHDPSESAMADDREVEFVHEKIAAVILAAGSSSRFSGAPKQTLLWRGIPFVRHVADTALESGLSPVIVVTGSGKEKVEEAVEHLRILIRHNPDSASGQSTSVIAGMARVPPACGGVLFFLADQPQVDSSLVNAIRERHGRTLAAVVAPRVSGRRGNPVLFDKITFGDLSRLTGDAGGRALFSSYPVEWVDWEDDGILMDVDTEEDYRAFLEKYPDFMS